MGYALPALPPITPQCPPWKPLCCHCPFGYRCTDCGPTYCNKCVPIDAGEHTSLALGTQTNVASRYCWGQCPGGICLACSPHGVCYACSYPDDESASAAALPRSLPEVCSYMALGHHYGNCSAECEDISS